MGKKANEVAPQSNVIPFVTGNLDTSGEGVREVQQQVQKLVDYNDENHIIPGEIGGVVYKEVEAEEVKEEDGKKA